MRPRPAAPAPPAGAPTDLLDDPGRLAALVARHDRPGPRYTSYPTAVSFTAEHGAEAHLERLGEAAGRTDEPIAVYVHVPFCERRCTYCGCHMVPTRRRRAGDVYLDHLEREVELVAGALGSRRPVAALHLGGGTPTWYAPEELERLVGHLLARFPPARGAELSVEVDPRVTRREHLDALRSLGFDRVSLGVQDFAPAVQEAIGRGQTAHETEACARAARAAGFRSVNLDLVYGLPRQTRESLETGLEQAVRLRPDRVALYGYAHVPWIKPHQQRIDASELPGPEERLRLFLTGWRVFRGAGWEPVGMDHFAQPDDELAHAARDGTLGRSFMGYTTHGDLETIGLGCSAIGRVGDAYAQNHPKLADYYRAVAAGRLPVARGVVATPEDAPSAWVIRSLLCRFGVDATEYAERFGEPFERRFAPELERLVPLERDGLVRRRDGGVEVTPVGRLFVRNVALVFDRRLGRERRDGPRFSRTV